MKYRIVWENPETGAKSKGEWFDNLSLVKSQLRSMRKERGWFSYDIEFLRDDQELPED